jgi:hypothetical protein
LGIAKTKRVKRDEGGHDEQEMHQLRSRQQAATNPQRLSTFQRRRSTKVSITADLALRKEESVQREHYEMLPPAGAKAASVLTTEQREGGRRKKEIRASGM